jgi:hypothetical protein
MPSSCITSSPRSDLSPPSGKRPAPVTEALLGLAVDDSFAGNWRTRAGVYAAVSRLRKTGMVREDFAVTIMPDEAGEGRWRVWRVK